ncbi:tripartite tricarboxylate transporter substrate binding protein [Hydrogenophaga sp. 2FB]|uniref:Bug family tripartite tricarboxylate transporter substrate binding protein n=1 Tax=Hydrogenophaga sp. 2FB TaxID=2502187 RepID=UPI001485923D|nr:tripartite tricarboxylate transporter substrate binding protein [Hydrogenophaga sp. 2FB]
MSNAVHVSRRNVLLGALGAATVLTCGAQTPEPGWDPRRPIRFIVPFGAGGYTDAVARLVAQHLGVALGQPTTVENRPGANGVVGTGEVARAPADGHTLLVVAPGHAGNVTMVPKLPYDTLKDFTPVNLLVTLPSVVIVPASSPINTLQDLLKTAKAQPGRLNYGSGGNGSSQHMAMEMLKHKARVSMTHIPYRGSSFAEADLLGAQLDVMFSSTISAIPLAKAGKIKILAISSETRSAALPSVPTIAEAALPGFSAVTWNGLFAPAGTPPQLIARLSAEVNKLMLLPEVQERLVKLGAEHPVNTPQQFDAFVRKEIAEQGAVIKAAGIKAD